MAVRSTGCSSEKPGSVPSMHAGWLETTNLRLFYTPTLPAPHTLTLTFLASMCACMCVCAHTHTNCEEGRGFREIPQVISISTVLMKRISDVLSWQTFRHLQRVNVMSKKREAKVDSCVSLDFQSGSGWDIIMSIAANAQDSVPVISPGASGPPADGPFLGRGETQEPEHQASDSDWFLPGSHPPARLTRVRLPPFLSIVWYLAVAGMRLSCGLAFHTLASSPGSAGCAAFGSLSSELYPPPV